MSDDANETVRRLLDPSYLTTATAVVESAHTREDRYDALGCDGPGRIRDGETWLACGLLARARRSDIISETREPELDADGRESFPLRPDEKRWVVQ